ncbi:MAG: molybdate ABC transporter permease subunit [Burkholderiales bacterium]
MDAALVPLLLTLKVAAWASVLATIAGVAAGWLLAKIKFPGRGIVDALLLLPMVLPPTVLGYYLLTGFAPTAPLGAAYQSLFGAPLAFTFQGLLVASLIANIPFAVQPVQRAFEAIAPEVREAAWVAGLSNWQTFWRIELPLAWPGLATAFVLTFAHTLGEFGVVLMVGGNIPGETRTAAVAIYDRVQALDDASAGAMAALLLAIAFIAIAFVYWLDYRRRRHG